MNDAFKDTFLLTDRTTTETDWKCGMARWWYKNEGGTGIVPVNEPSYFSEGRETHEDLAFVAGLAEPYSPEVAAQLVVERFWPLPEGEMDMLKLETSCRRAGWAAAFALYEEPKVRAEFEQVAAESELILSREPLWMVCTPDRILKRRVDGRLVYREYKTTRFANYQWVNYWPHAIQLHIGLQAAAEEYELPLAYAQVMGLMKGTENYGKLRHPYVWALYDATTGEWEPCIDGARETSRLTLRPVWEYDGGIIEWVKKLGPEVAKAQFPFSMPVFLDERMLEQHLANRLIREQEVYAVQESCQVDFSLRAEYFEQRTINCRPVVGSPCVYQAACWNKTVRDNPLASGLYKVREPHHEVEVLAGGEN